MDKASERYNTVSFRLVRMVSGDAVTVVGKSKDRTPNNAVVRLHPARKGLHALLVQTCGSCTEHGYLDCACKGS